MELKNKYSNNNYQHNKEDNINNIDKKSSHKNVTSTQSEVNNNNEKDKSKRIDPSAKSVPSYLLELKNKDENNNYEHSKNNNNNNIDKKSSHESVISTLHDIVVQNRTFFPKLPEMRGRRQCMMLKR